MYRSGPELYILEARGALTSCSWLVSVNVWAGRLTVCLGLDTRAYPLKVEKQTALLPCEFSELSPKPSLSKPKFIETLKWEFSMKSIWTSAIIATLALSGCLSEEGATAQDPVPVLTEDPGPILPPSSVKFTHYYDSNGQDYTYHVERDLAILEWFFRQIDHEKWLFCFFFRWWKRHLGLG